MEHNQTQCVKSRDAKGWAESDMLVEFGRPDVVARLQDEWRRLPAPRRRGREAFLAFLEDAGDLDQCVIDAMVDWQEWQSVV
jgi:hypothetical protein